MNGRVKIDAKFGVNQQKLGNLRFWQLIILSDREN